MCPQICPRVLVLIPEGRSAYVGKLTESPNSSKFSIASVALVRRPGAACPQWQSALGHRAPRAIMPVNSWSSTVSPALALPWRAAQTPAGG